MEGRLSFIAIILYVYGTAGLILAYMAIEALRDIEEDLHDIARNKDND